MTDDVADLVLEDNRLQTLALSIAEAGGAQALPGHVRTIELLEASGRLDRKVEGLGVERGAAAARPGKSRPDAARARGRAVDLQARAPGRGRGAASSSDDPLVEPQLFDAFPKPMRKAHAEAIRAHRLRNEIIATKVANRLVNRLGPGVAFDLTEEEGASLQQVVVGLPRRRAAARPRQAVAGDRAGRRCPRRFASSCSRSRRRASAPTSPTFFARPAARRNVRQALRDCSSRASARFPRRPTKLIRSEVTQRSRGAPRPADGARRQRRHRPRPGPAVTSSTACSASPRLPRATSSTSSASTRAYTRLGEALGLDWAQQQVARFVPADQWERLLTAGLARDFEQLRIEFLSRCRGKELDEGVDELGRASRRADRPVPRADRAARGPKGM